MKLSITLTSIIVLVAAAPVEVRDPQVGNGVGPGLNQGPSRGPQDSIVNNADRPNLNKVLGDNDRGDVYRPTSGEPQEFYFDGTNLPGLNEELDDDDDRVVAPPPPSTGSVNEKGFTEQQCRRIIANHGKTVAEQFGVRLLAVSMSLPIRSS